MRADRLAEYVPTTEQVREGPSRVERNLDDLDRAEADRDIWRERWQQLMREHEEAVRERNSAETRAVRAEAALARVRGVMGRMHEFLYTTGPCGDGCSGCTTCVDVARIRAAIEGTDS